MPPRSRGLGQSLPTTARRLNLADGTTFDPGSRLVSPITDLGAGLGLRFSLTGSWSSTDWCGAYPGIIWSLKDILGTQISGNNHFSLPVDLAIRSGPGDSSDTIVRFGIVNESDVTSATIDGVVTGMAFTAANRNGVVGMVTNGTSTTVAGSSVAGGVWVESLLGPNGVGSGKIILTPRTVLLDINRAYITGSAVNAAPSNGTVLGLGSLYLVLVAGRTAATVGDVTLDVDAYVQAPYTITPPS